MADEQQGFQVPAGLIVVTTHGPVMVETAQSIAEMRARAVTMGLNNVEFRFVMGHLVDKARNEAANMLLNGTAQWLWFLDADMAFQATLLDAILATAYRDCTWADVVGGYCQLRGEPYLPTINTGTGTWEPVMAGIGPVEVIRTGGACLLIKRHVFEKMEYPWFGVRAVPRAIDMLTEVDNYARIKFDGRNPFAGLGEWNQLLACAQEDALRQRQKDPAVLPRNVFSTVGEDSNFADRAHALGFRIVVQTNAVVGHIDRKIIQPGDLAEAYRNIQTAEDQAAGVLG